MQYIQLHKSLKKVHRCHWIIISLHLEKGVKGKSIAVNINKLSLFSRNLKFKGYLCYETILCYKVALDVQLMTFFI